MKRIALIAIMLCVVFCAFARRQKTTRPGLRTEATRVEEPFDTLRSDSLVIISGYEKMLRSSSESLLITNLSADTIECVGLTIEYFDSRHRQLHKRSVNIRATVPPSETRMASFPAWDKQKVWYYTLSAPARTSAPASPFTVSITTDYILIPK